jgi:uridine phosphorylase
MDFEYGPCSLNSAMAKISPTDLILNRDGSVYHLNLLPKHLSETIIAVGDPNRVYQVSKHFDDVSFEMNKREFITHVGKFKGKKITVISTGIGTDNIEIVLTELDALANVDLEEREVRGRKKKLKIIRIGTSGALQEDIPVGAHVVSEYGVGFDNLMQFYSLDHTPYELEIGRDICEQLQFPFTPYVVKGSEAMLNQIGFDMIVGNTITAPGFYAPQGRQVRAPIRFPKLLEDLNCYHHKSSNFWLTNFEMETAGYYSLGRILGHEILSVNAIIGNRVRNEFAKKPEAIVDALITKVLDRI